MPKKWGPCSSDGVVTFAEDLAGAGEAFQDYGIVHELIHFRCKTHGERFQALMSMHVPNWRALKRGSRHSTVRQTEH
jgi:predicted metal-dependent hydrolase